MNFFKKAYWSPYGVGAGIGILTCLSYFFFQQLIGISAAFVNIVCFIEKNVVPTKCVTSGSLLTFQVFLIVGIFFGALTSSLLGKTWRSHWVPSLWQDNFGPSRFKRLTAALFGGCIMMIGARIAGGCTSGKAISSGLQLGVSAWIFIGALFITGIIVAHGMYRSK